MGKKIYFLLVEEDYGKLDGGFVVRRKRKELRGTPWLYMSRKEKAAVVTVERKRYTHPEGDLEIDNPLVSLMCWSWPTLA